MKIKFIAAFILAATFIVFISCDLFRSKKLNTSNPLIGKWQLDSIGIGKDTSLAYLFTIALIKNDTAGLIFRFANDTVFTNDSSGETDTAYYSWNEKTASMIMKDSTSQIFHYMSLNDSLISLSLKDSVALFLKRK